MESNALLFSLPLHTGKRRSWFKKERFLASMGTAWERLPQYVFVLFFFPSVPLFSVACFPYFVNFAFRSEDCFFYSCSLPGRGHTKQMKGRHLFLFRRRSPDPSEKRRLVENSDFYTISARVLTLKRTAHGNKAVLMSIHNVQ